MSNKTIGSERLVVILTEFKEIFCGWTEDTTGEWIKLRAARQACFFSAETHGLLGLAQTGPAKGSKIGPPADIECRKIVNVIECSPEAVDTWSEAKWA